MRVLFSLGLRARLALALVAVAVLAVGLATLLANRGVHPRVSAAAEQRLDASAAHMAQVAAAVYADDRVWTESGTNRLGHLARLNGLSVAVFSAAGARVSGRTALAARSPAAPRAEATVRSGGREVGRIVVTPLSGELLSSGEEHLQTSLNRLHLAAGGASVAAALLVAFLLAQTLSRPLRRIRVAAERIERGDLQARVTPGGDAEVSAVAHALNRLAETLEHEEEIRKETVADLAHELRTPVTGLLSRIEAAQDGVLADEAVNLERMHAEAIRLARLLEDLGELAEAERPGLLLDKRPLDLAAVMRQEAESFAPSLTERGISLTMDLEPTWVDGDAGRLGQIAANLLSNALRYTESRGEVRVSVREEDGLAVLEVTDSGIGIAPDDLKLIFNRFWRGERSRSRATGGAGIGLAIVRELVRAHDGRIEVDSVPGRGSRFRVLLTAAGREASKEAAPSPRPPRSLTELAR